MTEEEFVLTQERISNVEARCKSIELDMNEYMDKNPKANDQWIEKRIRVLEDKVKYLMEEVMNAKRTKADSRCNATDKLQRSGVSQHSDSADEENRG